MPPCPMRPRAVTSPGVGSSLIDGHRLMLDNGTIRLGVDLRKGGAITWLASLRMNC